MTKLYTLIPDPRRSVLHPGEEIRFLLIRNDEAYPEPKDIKWSASTPDGVTIYASRDGGDRARMVDTFETEGDYTVSVNFRVGSSNYTKEHSFKVAEPVSGSLRDMLRITTDPPMTTIVPNQKMNFKLEKTGPIEGIESVSDLKPRWFCYNDMEHARWLSPKIYRGGRGVEWRGEDWDFVGEHRVVCAITYQGADVHLELPITVISNETMAETAPIVSAHPNDPKVALDAGISAYNTILKFEEEIPPPPEKRDAYVQRMNEQRGYLGRLSNLLETSKGETRVPIYAMYHSHYNPRIKETHSQWMPLNVFVSYDADGQYRLVDWTNPSSERSQGDYDGWSAGIVWNRHHSTSEVLSAWDWHNQYPDGIIRFRYFESDSHPIAMNVGGKMEGNSPVLPSQLTEVEGDFETDGSSAADEASAILDYIAIGAAVVAGVATLIAPVPGSRVLSAAIWASIFTSTAAATINIAQRQDSGFGSVKSNAFDVLTIASNLFAAGAVGRVWARGATLTIKATTIQRMVLVGQFGTDGIQGVMIAVDSYNEFEKIRDDPSLAPDERFWKIAAWVGRVTVDGTLTAINLRGTKADLDNMARQNTELPPTEIPAEKLERLKDPNAEVELDLDAPVEGNTGDSVHKTEAQTTPKRVAGKVLSQQDLARRLKQEVEDAMAAEAKVGNKNRSPAVAVVIDKETGEVFSGRNKGPVNGSHSVPSDLDEILKDRITKAKEDTVWFENREKFPDGEFKNGDYETFGNHAEVWALNDAIKARRKAGLPVTQETLNELFLMDVRRTKKYSTGNIGDHFKRCPDCSRLTNGIDLFDGLRDAETH